MSYDDPFELIFNKVCRVLTFDECSSTLFLLFLDTHSSFLREVLYRDLNFWPFFLYLMTSIRSTLCWCYWSRNGSNYHLLVVYSNSLKNIWDFGNPLHSRIYVFLKFPAKKKDFSFLWKTSKLGITSSQFRFEL